MKTALAPIGAGFCPYHKLATGEPKATLKEEENIPKSKGDSRPGKLIHHSKGGAPCYQRKAPFKQAGLEMYFPLKAVMVKPALRGKAQRPLSQLPPCRPLRRLHRRRKAASQGREAHPQLRRRRSPSHRRRLEAFLRPDAWGVGVIC